MAYEVTQHYVFWYNFRRARRVIHSRPKRGEFRLDTHTYTLQEHTTRIQRFVPAQVWMGSSIEKKLRSNVLCLGRFRKVSFWSWSQSNTLMPAKNGISNETNNWIAFKRTPKLLWMQYFSSNGFYTKQTKKNNEFQILWFALHSKSIICFLFRCIFLIFCMELSTIFFTNTFFHTNTILFKCCEDRERFREQLDVVAFFFFAFSEANSHTLL